MIAYAYVKKGLHHDEGVCEDTVVLGNQLVKGGFVKVDLGEHFIVGVSDGVGGVSAGDIASGISALALSQLNAEEIARIDVIEAIDEANEKVYEIGETVPSMKDMAATFTVFGNVLDGQFIFQLGNSRMYEIVNWGMGPTLVQLTRDHNRLNDFIAKGVDTEEIIGTREAEVLTTYMGMRRDIFENAKDINTDHSTSESTQRIFITSDGIHDHIPADELSEAFFANGKPEEILRNIADLALERGSRDDISIILLVENEEDLLADEEE